MKSAPLEHLNALSLVGKTKKQRTRLLKAECSYVECGYTVRVTRKWVVELGAPICPVRGHGAMHVADLADDDD